MRILLALRAHVDTLARPCPGASGDKTGLGLSPQAVVKPPDCPEHRAPWAGFPMLAALSARTGLTPAVAGDHHLVVAGRLELNGAYLVHSKNTLHLGPPATVAGDSSRAS